MPVEIIASSIKEKPTEGEKTPYSVRGRVVDSPVENPGVGISYRSGPAASIKIIIDGEEYELERGNKCISSYYRGTIDPGIEIEQSGEIIFPADGHYEIWLIAGRVAVEENIFYIQDRRDFIVKVEEKPGFPEIPLEWVAAAVIGVVAFGSIAIVMKK